MNEVVFTHRPQLGVSVGAFQQDIGSVILAVAITNFDAGDVYDKGTARRIIESRIRNVVQERHDRLNFTTRIEVDGETSAADVIRTIRGYFKPDPDEQDETFTTFVEVEQLGLAYRVRNTADDIWESILVGFGEACSVE